MLAPMLAPISQLLPVHVALTGRLLEEAGRESPDSGRVAAAEEGRVVAVDLTASRDVAREGGRDVLPVSSYAEERAAGNAASRAINCNRALASSTSLGRHVGPPTKSH